MAKSNGQSVNLSSDQLSSFDKALLETAKRYEQASEEDIIDFNNTAVAIEAFKKSEFSKWLEGDRHVNFNATPIIEDYVIIEVFFYNVLERKSNIIMDDLGGNKLSDYKILPLAKVLSTNSSKVNKGDIVSIPAIMGKTVRSTEWVDWKQKTIEQPSLAREFPEPPVYVGKLNEWMSYIYQENPLEDLNTLDQHTFCLPVRMLQALEK